MKKREEQACCPEFDPHPWDDVTLHWKDKIFVMGSVMTFLYNPLNFGSVIKKMDKAIHEEGADWKEGLCLSDHTSKWNMDLYIAVDKPVKSLDNKIMTGMFYCKAYEGPFRDTGKWHKDFEQRLAEKGIAEGKIYLWYTTCPKCARKYGKNWVVMLADIG
ncbi:MAG: hypothetical protein LWW85_04410 [Marinilabiliales bacterium]|nr:hypothetical protein [Marinilabiliales bacterium]